MTNHKSDEQPNVCRLCGYEMKIGDSFLIHIAMSHAFTLEQLIHTLPKKTVKTLLDKNIKLFEAKPYGIVKCLECGKTIESRYRHDYVECGCPNATMVDGGTWYTRLGAKNPNKVKVIQSAKT